MSSRTLVMHEVLGGLGASGLQTSLIRDLFHFGEVKKYIFSRLPHLSTHNSAVSLQISFALRIYGTRTLKPFNTFSLNATEQQKARNNPSLCFHSPSIAGLCPKLRLPCNLICQLFTIVHTTPYNLHWFRAVQDTQDVKLSNQLSTASK